MSAASRRAPLALALASLTLFGAIAVWGGIVDPSRATRWLVLAVALPAVWGYVELAQVRGRDELIGSAIMRLHRLTFAWTGLFLSIRAGTRVAVSTGLLDAAFLPGSRRVAGVLIGMGLVLFGNHLPKLVSPWRFQDEPFDWQRVHRFAGWACLLAGLVLTGVWLAGPPSLAARVTPPIVGCLAVTIVARKAVSLASRWRTAS